MKILITEPENYSSKALRIYSELGQVVSDKKLDRQELLLKIKDIDILVIRLGHVIDKEVVDRAGNLKIIASPTTGLNHIDIGQAAAKGIKVISLKGEVRFLREIYATAEHTLALLLSLIRKLPWGFNSIINEGRWDRDSYKGKELAKKTLGVIGFGRLGSRVTRIAQGFDMNVLAHDPHISKFDIKSVGAAPAELDYLLQCADIISVHVPLNKETQGMVDADMISKMKNGVFLVNTSRGEIIDEETLLAALNSGKIAGAALDVLSDELSWGDSRKIIGSGTSIRLIEYARKHDNLLITPHIGGATHESMEKTEIFIANKVKDLCIKEKLQSEL